MDDLVYKALLVGNSIFEEDSRLFSLKGPPNDVRSLEDALTHPQIGLHANENVISLLECNHTEIMEKLENFFCEAGRNDQLLFYYSGHGWLDKYTNLYLCARNTKTSSLISSAIPDTAINSMIKNSNSCRIILILDCCHSGNFKGGLDIPENLKGEGRFVITSSRAQQLAEDAKTDAQNSPFTKHLVSALLSSEVDTNRDNYVSLNEVYNYILPRLQDEIKQRPQRNYEGAVGGLTISKSIVKEGISTGTSPHPEEDHPFPPRLAVSTTNIEIKDVDPDEHLREEIIDVFNEGGGRLEWDVECNDEWIKVEKFKGYFTLNFNPVPGKNRGRIYVRAKEGGGSKLIQVLVKMNETVPDPILEVSPNSLDFGSLVLNAEPPKKTIRIINKGGGDLDPKVSCSNKQFNVRLINDLVEVSPDLTSQGELHGELFIESAGGEVKIPLKALIELGPILKVSPKNIDFGTINEGVEKKHTLTISNSGSSKLDWNFTKEGNFFTVNRKNDRLKVAIKADIGSHHGVIIIKSNGGDATVSIKGRGRPKKTAPKTPAHAPTDISGTWSAMGVSTVVINKFGNSYKFQEYNFMGVCCSEGTLTPQGDHYILAGYNIMTGQVTGIFRPQNNQIHATLTTLGETTNIVLTRSNQNNLLNILNLDFFS